MLKTALLLTLALALTVPAHAEPEPDGDPKKGAMAGKPAKQASKDKAGGELQNKAKDKGDWANKQAKQGKQDKKSQASAEAQNKTKNKADWEQKKADKTGAGEGAKEQTGGAKSKGSEMQARKEERKALQEEYRQGKKSGEREAVKGKKPWWKFWVFE